MTFKELGLRAEILSSLTELGFEEPTPIQQKAIPYLLGEQGDFVGLAQTGTGKTAAFGLPLLEKVQSKSKLPQGVVICPTRELCLQIAKDIKSYSKDLKTDVVAVYGGADIKGQMQSIKKGVSVVVATPGRLVDLIKRKAIKLEETKVVVLDEADEMLNMGFKEDIDRILESTPDEKNVWLFSATMPKEVARISKNYMTDPFEVSVGEKNQTNKNIDHVYFVVKERDRYAALKRLIDFNTNIYGLIFCRTRRETAAVAEKLGRDGYSAEPLHGDLSQAQRDRVMRRFRDRDIQLLVATDVAARGIDVDDITHVINYNLPDETENYTHRSGRTARAGKKGESLVLINSKESYKIKAIENKTKTEMIKGFIPQPHEICELQLMKLVDKVVSTKVKEKDIERFLPLIMNEFEEFSKEDVIKMFVSTEFNRFIDYYERAGDLNVREGKSDSKNGDRKEGRRGDRRDRSDVDKTRFFVSMGDKDGLNPGGLVRTICDNTNISSSNVGRIDIMHAFSFFEADTELKDKILKGMSSAQYEGKNIKVEVTEKRKGNAKKGGKKSNSRHRSRRK